MSAAHQPDTIARHCIRRPHVAEREIGYCGRSLLLEWTWLDIDHALAGADPFKGVCLACVARVREMLEGLG